jgi:DNA-binding beta-propeller fold protein YncE
VTTSMPPLALAYAFVPSPTPILASVAGANPSTVSLQVLVSNPSTQGVTLTKIQIVIPTGIEASRDISTAPSLPAPTYDTSIPWHITTDGSVVTIVPARGRPGQVTSPIVFTLPGIQVNHTAGTVPITVTEFQSGSKVEDDWSYSVVKQPANFPVTSFSANPAALHVPDQPVTLFWTCSDQGQAYDYGLRTESVDTSRRTAAGAAPPGSVVLKDCVGDGQCYTCADGAQGVAVGPVPATTTYALDAVGTDGSDNKVVVDTLTVPVLLPCVSSVSYVSSYSRFGRLVRLNWPALNATSCSVVVGEKTVVENAPVDTYVDGYVLVVNQPPGSYIIQIVANGPAGSASTRRTIGQVIVGPAAQALNGQVGNMALTPNGALALVTVAPANGGIELAIADATTGELSGSPLALMGGNAMVAATPDSRTAVVADASVKMASIVDLAGRQVVAGGITLGDIEISPQLIAITPDSQHALIPDINQGVVRVIDIPGRRAGAPITLGGGVYTVAVSPTGNVALVVNVREQTATVLAIPGFEQQGAPVAVGDEPIPIAFTPDGSTAFVANVRAAALSAVELTPTIQAGTGIPVGTTPTGITVTPDGRKALVPIQGPPASLAVVDLPDGQFPTWVLRGTLVSTVAISPDGSCALVGTYSEGLIVLDMKTLAPVVTIPVEGSVAGVAYTPDGTTAAVVTSIDTNTSTPSGSVLFL